MTKTFALAALPLILSLTLVSAAQARPTRFDGLDGRGIPPGTYLVIPYGSYEAQMRESEHRPVRHPPLAQSEAPAKDPFADMILG